MILFVSDLDLRGSGYMNIAIALCNQLAERGHDIYVLGIGYSGDEHNWPFAINPVESRNAFQHIHAMLQNLQNLARAGQFPQIEGIIVALDIPMQEKLLEFPRGDIPYCGIFPIESGPLCPTWASTVGRMDERLVISKFGHEQIADAGLKSTYLPVGIDTDSWRPPDPKERASLRKSLGFEEDDFVVLTVADNQERKNLSAAAQIVAGAREHIPVKWQVVTRIDSKVGWELHDPPFDLGKDITLYERGLSFDRLWMLYAVSDAFLLTSKAEGLAQLPGSTVWLREGVVPIENVQTGHEIWTHKGTSIVTSASTVEYSGPILTIEPALGLETLRLTPEHPLLLSRKTNDGVEPVEWVEAEDVKKGDYIAWPTIPAGKTPDIRISDHVEGLIHERDGKVVTLEARNGTTGGFTHPRYARHDDEVSVDSDLMEILGFYVAEGCAADQGPLFCFHTEEERLHARVERAMDNKFGVSPTITKRDRHRLTMTYNDRLIGRFLEALCPGLQPERHLPPWALELPADLAWTLIECMWLGDGSIQTDHQLVARYSTASFDLARQLQFLLLRLGVAASLIHDKRGAYSVRIYRPDWLRVPFLRGLYQDAPKKEFSKSKAQGNYRLIPIKSVERMDYDGPVHHIEVDEDECYLSAAGILHNCMPIIEAMAVGVPVAATECTAVPEHLYIERGGWRPKMRGFPIDVEFTTIDPWGNSERSFVSIDDGIKTLRKMYKLSQRGKMQPYIEAGIEYAKSRTWDDAGDVLEGAVRRLKAQSRIREGDPRDPVNAGVPPTIPQVLPRMGGDDSE